MESDHAELLVLIVHLRRYARALVGRGEDAEDLVQETLARAVARMNRDKGDLGAIRNRKSYLFAILHNAHVDRMPERYRARNVVSIHDVAHILPVEPNQGDRAQLNDLERALGALPEEYRQVVLLVGLEGFTYQEAADTLGIPVGTVMSRLSRGREKLRRGMAPEVPETPKAAAG